MSENQEVASLFKVKFILQIHLNLAEHLNFIYLLTFYSYPRTCLDRERHKYETDRINQNQSGT